ncbi:XdhC family protein [Aliiglaciecola lipolytica]|uniref:Xanthine dehydrogenase accessory factor n=1 Tax=Aliiglaciecola lipolytica E3 TaxID=1127673 RepID=K6X2L2_9ALTE|nr:XdhC family protein [Aliiglaciecola lipolytica]GAC14864.1 hypothetical protein GLIP_2236 [Aliiglaciecola lipolytica E3]
MANTLSAILSKWFEKKDTCQWVLATIFETQGSSYRKPGAHMLINDLGEYHGLLSGGCLESDIMLQSRKCWDNGQGRIVEYDMTEEEDLAWKLGIGCGGLVKILLQPISAQNDYLNLDKVYSRINHNGHCRYAQAISSGIPQVEFDDLSRDVTKKTHLVDRSGQLYLEQILCPPVNLCVFGAGVDARPVVNFAVNLGWRVTLVDPRTSHGRRQYFDGVQQIIKQPMKSLVENAHELTWLKETDAIIIMSHNLSIDAQAVLLSAKSKAKYVGMLGPIHRTQRVFVLVDLDRRDYPIPFANPIGLRLGGELPESIALSMVSEVHCFLEQQDGNSISGIL